MTKIEIAKATGTPALLEQVAEECMELAHACIKAARKIRNESYTPVDRTTLSYKLHEETADVINSIDVLHYNGTLDYDMVSEIANAKMARWSERVAMRSK